MKEQHNINKTPTRCGDEQVNVSPTVVVQEIGRRGRTLIGDPRNGSEEIEGNLGERNDRDKTSRSIVARRWGEIKVGYG